MLKEYSVAQILESTIQSIPYYTGTFEGTDDPDIEWPHRYSFYSLVWFTKGSGFNVIDFDDYEIKPNRVFFISPKQVHNWDYSDNCEGFVLMVDCVLGYELNLDYAYPYVDLDEDVSKLLKVVYSNMVTNYQINHDIRIDIQYIHQLINRFIKPNQHAMYQINPVMNELKVILAEKNQRILSVKEYADKLHISEDELNCICKETTGMSAKQLILGIKITEAKRLLLYTDYHINEISFMLGFEDNSYFSRIFKKKNSLSPSDFLKKYRK